MLKLKNLLRESIVGMDKIVHIDEMSTDEFIKFVKGFIDVSNRNIEISEKIDGQNLSFGLDDSDNFFTKTKKSRPVFDPSTYGDFSFLDGIKNYHNILVSNIKVLENIKEFAGKLDNIDTDFTFQVFCEILPTSQTNIVIYNSDTIGKGAIVLFDIKINGISILKKQYSKKLFATIVDKLDGLGGWRVYDKPLKNESDFVFDVKHLITLETVYRKYFDILTSRKHADKHIKEKAKKTIQALMNNIKQQFINKMVLNRKSILGDITPEGFILRDFSNNLLVKLVDKDSFSKENMEGSRFVKDAMTVVKNNNTSIKNDIFGNADILKNFAKVIEKTVDWAFVQKQNNSSFKVDSLNDILKVVYDDMMEENRIKYTASVAITKTVDYVQDMKNKLSDILINLKKESNTIPESKYKISFEKISAYIKSADDIIKKLNGLIGSNDMKIYLTIMTFVFGPSKISELKSQFNLL